MPRPKLDGKRVLLTGASGGIGVAVARTLAAAGAELILTARDAARLEALARECEGLGARVELRSAELVDPEARARLVEDLAPDILINNAGVETTKRLLSQTNAEVEAQLQLNLAATIDLTRRVLPGMLERGAGTIVNVSSMSGKGSTPYNAVYAATKSGLVGFSASVRDELRGTGVHVGVVCPGPVSAGMWDRAGVRAPLAIREVSPEQCARAITRVIAGKGEVLVTGSPVRPLLALFALFPAMEARLMRATGVTAVLRERADRLEREPPGST